MKSSGLGVRNLIHGVSYGDGGISYGEFVEISGGK
jgi:hypothetical protein